jgi:hypothetical protein
VGHGFDSRSQQGHRRPQIVAARFRGQRRYIAVSADFGAWQIALSGDGKNVRMKLPLSNVKLVQGDQKSSPSRAARRSSVQLHFIPHTGAQVNAAGAIPSRWW